MSEEATLATPDPSASEDQTEPARVEPKRIGRYQLCFQLASGGMATVYLARAIGLGGFEKLVALKRIHPHLAVEQDYIDMFLDEARIASRITHSNVCSVFDFGEADGEHFIAMEYLVGESLSRVARRVARDQKLRRNPRYPAFICRIVADACEGLHAAHELRDARGNSLHVVHRDVSTSNVFVSYNGVTRVVDFGIASAANRLTKTNTGVLKGKIAYMAPEQIRRGTVNRQTDVWALGIMLWELLTFRRLFRRSSEVETMYAILEADVPKPSEIRSAVPAPLDEICVRALQRDQKDRYQSAREMGEDLVKFLGASGDPVGLSALASWMEELFPAGEARKRQLMELAHHIEEEVPNVGEDSHSHSTIQTAASVLESRETKIPTRKWPAFAAVALLVAGLVAVGSYVLLEEAEPLEPELAVVEAPPPQTEPEPEPAAEPVEEPEPEPVEPVETAEIEPVEPEPEMTEAQRRREERRQQREEQRRREQAEARAMMQTQTAEMTQVAPPAMTMETPAATTGTVRFVMSGGWARVYDSSGRFVCVSPCSHVLPAGPQRLSLRWGGQPPGQSVSVNVPAGGSTTVRRAAPTE